MGRQINLNGHATGYGTELPMRNGPGPEFLDADVTQFNRGMLSQEIENLPQVPRRLAIN